MSFEDRVERLAGTETTGLMPAETEERLRVVYEDWLSKRQGVSELTFLLVLELWRIKPAAISYIVSNAR